MSDKRRLIVAGKILLSTDSASDLLKGQMEALGVRCIPLTYTIDGETFDGVFSAEEEYTAFYDRIRAGALPTTSLINEMLYREYFSALADEADEIVHLSLSSGLSGSYNNAVEAAEAVMRDRPGVHIYVVDSLGATQAQRITLDEGVALRDKGLSGKEIADGMKKCVSETQVYIVVDDLFHLKRGGRVSGAAAFIGSALNVKPVVILDDRGRLEVVGKVMGSKKALRYIFERMCKNIADPAAHTVYLAHADCRAYAEELKEMIAETFGCPVVVDWIGAVIGAHTGAGTLGLVYRGKERLKK